MNTRNRKKEYTPFNKNLKKFREASGVSIGDFADSLGLSRNTYIAYENQNREPSYAVLIKIADALHVSIDTLLGYEVDILGKCLQIANENGFIIKEFKFEDGHVTYWVELDVSKVKTINKGRIPSASSYLLQLFTSDIVNWIQISMDEFNKKSSPMLKVILEKNLLRMRNEKVHLGYVQKPEPPNSEGHNDHDL